MASVNILLSGGIDSTALVHLYLSQGIAVLGFHVNYGQPTAEREMASAYAVAAYYDIPLTMARIQPTPGMRGDEFLCRNALLVLAACSSLAPGSNRVAIGIHSGTPYYDCSSGFLQDMQRILDGYYGGLVTVEAPFLQWTKPEIFHYCKKYGVPIHLTYSCERNGDHPCGQCPSCHDRGRLLETE
ncbi:MAG: ATPase [Firmicutes bacterium]|nr:ATPase [Bacillota bacterium]